LLQIYLGGLYPLESILVVQIHLETYVFLPNIPE
jgi:hypothetical protein